MVCYTTRVQTASKHPTREIVSFTYRNTSAFRKIMDGVRPAAAATRVLGGALNVVSYT